MELPIDQTLVRQLIDSQFPQWKDLIIQNVTTSGWDNRSFRLGDDLLVRMPSAVHYASQVEKEQRWLPRLAKALPLPIPEPIAMGQPAFGYPWKWSVYRWIQGEPASTANIINMNDFVVNLAEFMNALEKIDASDAPLPGEHSFYRGGDLKIYDNETRQAIAKLAYEINSNIALLIWESALATNWKNAPVWVHGDISPGNLLVDNGKLSAVIDFGQLTGGDPACDLAIAWTMFDNESRARFREAIALDDETWQRGRAWALWKALIVASRLSGTNPREIENSRRSIDVIIADFTK